jgi:hypothetical protein
MTLARGAEKELEKVAQALGFERARRTGVYRRKLGNEGVVYLMCRPRAGVGGVTLEPMIALENFKLRALIGEDEPKQSEPRFAHLFLSYTAESGRTLWTFADEMGMRTALDEIERILREHGIPFSERWTQFRSACELLRTGLAGQAPWGVVIHPTRATREASKH